ncbi:MAG: hypothetical protein IKZ88_02665 [Neisseriaceae bacterium]|nr:hypothetical protein [Neisseriaceae bacterium]
MGILAHRKAARLCCRVGFGLRRTLFQPTKKLPSLRALPQGVAIPQLRRTNFDNTFRQP